MKVQSYLKVRVRMKVMKVIIVVIIALEVAPPVMGMIKLVGVVYEQGDVELPPACEQEDEELPPVLEEEDEELRLV